MGCLFVAYQALVDVISKIMTKINLIMKFPIFWINHPVYALSKKTLPMKTARIYQRVSTDEQSLERQNTLIEKAKAEGYYIAGVYKEKASGVRTDRPVLNQLIDDLQQGDVIIAEHID